MCVEGRGWVADIDNPDGARIVVDPGDVLIVPPNTPHSYGADENDPWTQLWFHATGARVEGFLAQLGVKGGPYKGRVSNLSLVKDSLHRINELRRHGCGRAVLLESAALGELAFARIYAEGCLDPVIAKGAQNGTTVRAKKLEALTAFFQKNFPRELVLTEVARMHNVSESWLYHAFAEHTGFSPLGFVIHLRLQETCRALATSDRKLDDIASSVGYNDAFYLSRLFKKHIGLTPTAYRESYSR